MVRQYVFGVQPLAGQIELCHRISLGNTHPDTILVLWDKMYCLNFGPVLHSPVPGHDILLAELHIIAETARQPKRRRGHHEAGCARRAGTAWWSGASPEMLSVCSMGTGEHSRRVVA